MRWLPLVGAAMVCTACHTYRQIPVAQIAAGNDIKLALTEAGRTGVTSAVGANAATVSGVVVSRDSVAMTIAVREIERMMADRTDLLRGEQVRIPFDAVAAVQLRQVSAVRSVLLGGVIAGVSALAIHGVAENINKTPNGPNTNPN